MFALPGLLIVVLIRHSSTPPTVPLISLNSLYARDSRAALRSIFDDQIMHLRSPAHDLQLLWGETGPLKERGCSLAVRSFATMTSIFQQSTMPRQIKCALHP